MKGLLRSPNLQKCSKFTAFKKPTALLGLRPLLRSSMCGLTKHNSHWHSFHSPTSHNLVPPKLGRHSFQGSQSSSFLKVSSSYNHGSSSKSCQRVRKMQTPQRMSFGTSSSNPYTQLFKEKHFSNNTDSTTASSSLHSLKAILLKEVQNAMYETLRQKFNAKSPDLALNIESAADNLKRLNIRNQDKNMYIVATSTLAREFYGPSFFKAHEAEFGHTAGQVLAQSDKVCQVNENRGFITFKPSPKFLQAKIFQALITTENWPLVKPKPQNALIDYSSPNLSKELHVGHLRSMASGESLARVLEYLGHKVDRVSHTGDFGVPIAVTIAEHEDYLQKVVVENQPITSKDLSKLYVAAKKNEKANAEKISEILLQMHGKLPMRSAVQTAWNLICEKSREDNDKIYKKLDIHVVERSESSYLPLIPDVLSQLRKKKVLLPSEGTQSAFIPDFSKPADLDAKLPMILVKSDGSYLYATTDAAALFFRTQVLCKNWLIYCTDNSQAHHFRLLFELGKTAGWIGKETRIDHLQFGLVRDKNKKKLSSREGDPYSLAMLLQETVDYATQNVNTDLLVDQTPEDVAEAVAFNSVRFNDILHHRNDYIFDLEQIVQYKGRTAPYIMYANSRIESVFRKLDLSPKSFLHKLVGKAESEPLTFDDCAKIPLTFENADEEELALLALHFPNVVLECGETATVNPLAMYMYQLAKAFHRFYNMHRFAEWDTASNSPTSYHASRLILALLVQKALQEGMNLLAFRRVTSM